MAFNEGTEKECIKGTVEDIVYKNTETGFAVLVLAVDGEPVTVVGELAAADEGEELTVWGEFTAHPTYGEQFKASACEITLPSGSAAILRYLSGGAVAGVGPTYARRIVDAFGDRALDVMAHEPKRLASIKGISPKKAEAICAEFRKIYGVREALGKLGALGLETGDALMLYKAYGDITPDIVGDNPYIMCGFPLYKPFEFADGIAGGLGLTGDHKYRIRAGLVYILRHNLGNGHTCIPTDKLIDSAYNYLAVGRDPVEIELYEAADEGFLKIDTADGDERVFLPEMLEKERYIAERLLLLSRLQFAPPESAESMIDDFQRKSGIVYEQLQRQAVKSALSSGVVVITGGPGTGKTTALNAIIALCEQNGDRVMLAAPTGRAAKRLSELTGKQAKTIHRLLEVDYRGDAQEVRFVHDENKPLNGDVVVVDEMSMVDVSLFDALLRGIRPQCRLVLVGDFNQLPSVGAGNLLRDIIDSGVCETVEFSRIFRQAAESLIVVNAHRIVGGDEPDLDVRQKDFFFIDVERSRGVDYICDLAGRRLPRAYGYDPLSDIQILTPSRIGEMGAAALNDGLRARLNPPGESKQETRLMGQLFREGDRVMQVRNNYDIEWTRDGGEKGLGVFNGDVGIIRAVNRRDGTLTCIFDDKTVVYSFDAARQLEPAFAVTVHKSQGSEYPAVILALGGVPRRLCYRNLLYTAVTRAKELLVLVGERNVVTAMVANDRKMLRYTGLRSFLEEGAP